MPRPTDWIDTRLGFNTTSGAQEIQSLMGTLLPQEFRGATLIRTIISMSMYSTTTAGVWGTQEYDMAIGIASQEAFTAGVVPDPNSPTEKPARGWLWKSHRVIEQNGSGGRVVVHVAADIRGARKIENGEIYLVVNNAALDGTPFTVRGRGLIRLLIKLS